MKPFLTMRSSSPSLSSPFRFRSINDSIRYPTSSPGSDPELDNLVETAFTVTDQTVDLSMRNFSTQRRLLSYCPSLIKRLNSPAISAFDNFDLIDSTQSTVVRLFAHASRSR